MFWPFTTQINCSSDLKIFANSRPSASNFKSFSRSLEQFFLSVGQTNFGNKIPLIFFSQMKKWDFVGPNDRAMSDIEIPTPISVYKTPCRKRKFWWSDQSSYFITFEFPSKKGLFAFRIRTWCRIRWAMTYYWNERTLNFFILAIS